jgi:alcohol dehydrogenase class IV
MFFTSEWSRVRVVFGAGVVSRLGAELDALGIARPLLVTTPGRAQGLAAVREPIGDRLAGVCDRAALHVPVERVRAALTEIDRSSPDALLAVGGGSAIGLAKAAALERLLPIVAVPTTYAGSEMTSIWGVTDGEVKRTGRSSGVAPRLVVYDPDLTLSLPPDVSAASGMNAIAHAVEAMYAAGAGPIATAAAEEAIRLLARALPAVVEAPGDRVPRAVALRGAHAAGVALELAAMGLHHKICHVLAAFNTPAAPEAMARVAGALGVEDAAAGLRHLNRSLGLTASLGTLGFRAEDVDRAADLITAAAYANPRPVTRDDVRLLLRQAL